MTSVAPIETTPPTLLDRYRLDERLSVGGTAEVWRALDERTNRPAAVKVLHPHLAEDDAARHRLIAEATAVQSLSHPGIIRVLAIHAGDRPAVILELVEGESLAQRIRRGGRLPQREAARIAASLADALYHAHTRGVIHRDVKPGNVLLAADGRPVLIDFGIARILGDEHAPQTETGMVMGTLRYMAPEQLAGQPLTPRVDLYGLGAVLFEMLTGTPPFPAASPVELLDQQSAGAPTLDGIDHALARVVRACLAPSPDDRPRHAGVVAAALRASCMDDPSPSLAAASPARRPASPLPPGDDLPPTIRVPAATSRGGEAGARAGTGGMAALSGRKRVGRARVAVAGVAALLAFGGAAALAVMNPGGHGGTATGDAATAAPGAIPAWAAPLAADYRQACGAAGAAGTTAGELAGMGQAAAQRYVSALSAQCAAYQVPDSTPAPANGPPSGSGQSSGKGHNRGNGHGHG